MRYLAIFCLATAALASPLSAATLLGPSPYLSFLDSPFAAVSFRQFVLEDFEDGSLDPTATRSAGAVGGPSQFTDSVDPGGRSLFRTTGNSITFNFSPFETLYGALPTHAGLVWTDVGRRNSDGGVGGPTQVSFTGTDGLGNSFSTIGGLLGDAFVRGETAEDRFFGVVNRAGIRTITITMADSNDWEMDHLQYGLAVPEPATWALLISGFGLVGMATRRRRGMVRAQA